jgi:phage baseplate assembly protein W
MTYIDFPFHFDGRGRTQTTDRDGYIRDLILQVLFTNPGERVNRPDFGCGLRRLVFTPNSDALATAIQFQVHTALQRWLAEVIQVHDVQATARDGELAVTVVYTRLDLAERVRNVLTFNVEGA